MAVTPNAIASETAVFRSTIFWRTLLKAFGSLWLEGVRGFEALRQKQGQDCATLTQAKRARS
jgi:hypothetical protein